MWLEVPFDRHAGVAPVDAGIDEDRHHPVDVAPASEQRTGMGGGVGLVDGEGGKSGLYRK